MCKRQMTEKEFHVLVTAYEKLVYTICYQLVQDAQIAEDLAQETFLSAYLHIDRCPKGAERPWLARIATNKAKDYLKSAYRRRVQLNQDDQEYSDKVIPFSSEPEEQFISREGFLDLRQKILDLREPYHKVSVLYFLEEKDITEIGKILNRPVKTVHTQLYRARSMLKESLKEAT